MRDHRARIRLTAALGSTWVLAAVVAVLTWPALDFGHIGTSLDDSWIAALHLASHRGLRFGSQIIWVYGPLGFLTVPRLAFVTQAIVSLAYTAVVVGVTAVTVLWAARRALPLWAALPLAVIGAGAMTTATHDDILTAAVVGVVAVWAIATLDPDAQHWLHRPWFTAIGGSTAALVFLVRPAAGVTVLIAVLITCLAASRSRRMLQAATCGFSFVVSVLALGLLSGQPPGALMDYASRSVDLILNYGDAIAEEKSPGSDYLFAAVAALIVGALWWRGTAGWTSKSRAAALAIVGLVLFAGFKQTFMKHSPHHVSYYFACAVALGFGLAALRRGFAGPLAGLVGLLAAFLATTGPDAALQHATSVAGWRELTLMAEPGRNIAAERSALRMRAQVDPQTLHALGARTVHVWPLETAVMWAYPQLHWRPLPVFQPGLGFTPRLDGVDTAMLLSPRAPERILRASNDVPPTNSPATRLALFCHYRQVHAGRRWQVLARGMNRCGRPRPIGSVQAQTGRAVRVPHTHRRDELVLASIRGLRPSVVDRIQGFFFKGPRWTLALGRSVKGAKLPVAVARGPFLLTIPRQLDYPPPFHFAADPDYLVIRAADPLRGQLGRRISVDFFGLPVH